MCLPRSCCVSAADPDPGGRLVGGYVERRRNHLLAAGGVCPFQRQIPGEDGAENQEGRVFLPQDVLERGLRRGEGEGGG